MCKMDSKHVIAHIKRFQYSFLVATLIVVAGFAHSKNLSGHMPTVGNAAIDTVDMEWWDDNKTLLFIDVTFNYPVSVTTEINDKSQKTHKLELVTPGTVAKSYKKIYPGSEHHAVPKRFRDFIDEIRYVGSRGGKADLFIYTYEPTVITYRMTNDLRTVHLEVSRLQAPKPSDRPAP